MDQAAQDESDSSANPSAGARVAVVVGFLLHVAFGALVLVSGLIMPTWAVGALGVVWVVALAAVIRWRSRPALVLGIPLVLLAIWVIMLWAGDSFLDWTA